MKKYLAIFLSALILLPGCGNMSKTAGGTLIGSGAGAVIGAGLGATLCGFIGDSMGLDVAQWSCLIAIIVAAVIAFGYYETAPNVVAKRAAKKAA